jgi:hypothetical protein
MKRIAGLPVIAAFTIFVASANVTLAAPLPPLRVDLVSSPIPLEMSVSWGKAVVRLDRGVVIVRLGNLPENPDTGLPYGVTLTDSSTLPETLIEVHCYRAWLLRVDKVGDEHMTTDGIDLGLFRLMRSERGLVRFSGRTDLTDRGFNVLAVTAEESCEPQAWTPAELVMDFTSGGPNGMIVLWTPLEPLP